MILNKLKSVAIALVFTLPAMAVMATDLRPKDIGTIAESAEGEGGQCVWLFVNKKLTKNRGDNPLTVAFEDEFGNVVETIENIPIDPFKRKKRADRYEVTTNSPDAVILVGASTPFGVASDDDDDGAGNDDDDDGAAGNDDDDDDGDNSKLRLADVDCSEFVPNPVACPCEATWETQIPGGAPPLSEAPLLSSCSEFGGLPFGALQGGGVTISGNLAFYSYRESPDGSFGICRNELIDLAGRSVVHDLSLDLITVDELAACRALLNDAGCNLVVPRNTP